MKKLKIEVSRACVDERNGVAIELTVKRGASRWRSYFLLAELNVSRQSVFRWLGKCGVPATPAARKALEKALENVPTPIPGLVARSSGWHGDRFVLGEEVLGSSGELVANAITLAGENIWRSTGTLKAWKKWARTVCATGHVPTFAFALGFAGPLLRFTAQTSLVVMLTGRSTLGKTSLLRLVGTVCGVGPAGFLESFNKSARGFEAPAMRHRDTLLLMDETSLLARDERQRAVEFGGLLFEWTSDVPRESNGRDRVPDSVRGALLLSSNPSAAEIISKSGAPFTEQMAVRILDIPVSTEFPVFTFDTEDRRRRADQVDRFLAKCGTAYGVAAPEFLGCLTQRLSRNQADVQARITRYIDEAMDLLGLPKTASPTDVRHARSVAIIHAAGRLAIRYDVFPATRKQLDEAACAVWQRIHHQAVMAVGRDPIREFVQGLLPMAPEMIDLTPPQPKVTVAIAMKALGFIEHGEAGEVTYMLTERGLGQLTGDPEFVLKALDERGMLLRDAAPPGRVGKRQKKVTVAKSPDNKKVRLRLYCIRASQTALLALAGMATAAS